MAESPEVECIDARSLAERDADCQPGSVLQNLTLPWWQARDCSQPHSRSHPMQLFNVQGMSCGHCVKAITAALQAKDPTANVRVELAAKEVGVESTLTAEEVIAAITEEGYEAKLA
jgi:copper chaperone